jgi:hypothetical protein
MIFNLESSICNLESSFTLGPCFSLRFGVTGVISRFYEITSFARDLLNLSGKRKPALRGIAPTPSPLSADFFSPFKLHPSLDPLEPSTPTPIVRRSPALGGVTKVD